MSNEPQNKIVLQLLNYFHELCVLEGILFLFVNFFYITKPIFNLIAVTQFEYKLNFFLYPYVHAILMHNKLQIKFNS